MEFGAGHNRAIFTRGELERRWKAHLAGLDIAVDLGSRTRDLTVETQHGVEIARALVTGARVLIPDEPTAVLCPAGADRLFERIRTLKAHGVTVILILHKIREVLAVAETVTVLRRGKLVQATIPLRETGAARIAEMIIGRRRSTRRTPWPWSEPRTSPLSPGMPLPLLLQLSNCGRSRRAATRRAPRSKTSR
jgi:simple sugar transport system ATP-binding protein